MSLSDAHTSLTDLSLAICRVLTDLTLDFAFPPVPDYRHLVMTLLGSERAGHFLIAASPDHRDTTHYSDFRPIGACYRASKRRGDNRF